MLSGTGGVVGASGKVRRIVCTGAPFYRCTFKTVCIKSKKRPRRKSGRNALKNNFLKTKKAIHND